MASGRGTPHSEPLPERTPTAADLIPTERITLRVGTKNFSTDVETLQESGFFSALFSGRWYLQAEEDGSIFIDADPELFAHVLRYLRRGVLPVFFDRVKGHDYGLYFAILEEARYFQIPRLVTWLSEKRYLFVVNVSYSATVVPETQLAHLNSLCVQGTDEEITSIPHWKIRHIYVCPRGIEDHRGKPTFCGRKCRNAADKMGSGGVVNEEALEILLVRKQISFHHNLCIEDRFASED